jgi:hypothetical protein
MDDTYKELNEGFPIRSNPTPQKKRLTRNKTKDGQPNVNQEIRGATPFQKDAKGRKNDGFLCEKRKKANEWVSFPPLQNRLTKDEFAEVGAGQSHDM